MADAQSNLFSNPPQDFKFKVCSKCKAAKPVDAFHPHRRGGRVYLRPRCKACLTADVREYYHNRSDEQRERDRQKWVEKEEKRRGKRHQIKRRKTDSEPRTYRRPDSFVVRGADGEIILLECGACRERKEPSEFSRDRTRPTGYRYRCKRCQPPRGKQNRRNRFRLNQYGTSLTVGEYEAMVQRQGGLCAICGGTNKNGRRLSLDHCHKTGKVRGLLCNNCNTGLGLFRDSQTALAAALAYLREHQQT